MRTNEEAVYLDKYSVITNALITSAVGLLRYYKFCPVLSRIKTGQNRQNKRKRIFPINHLL